MMLDADTALAGEPATTEDLADALRLAIGRLARRLRQQSLGDMTPSQRSVLASLEHHGPMRIGELARVENISAPSVTGIVNRLEGRGLVDRTEDPDDARSTLVSATRSGVEALEAARRERTALMTRGLEEMDPAQRRALAAAVPLLDRLVGGVG